MLVDLKKFIPDSKSMPRVYSEPHFFSEIPENITKVNTFLVYQEDAGGYTPTRCAIDELGMYLILGIGDGISIDLTHSIEVREKWLANLSDGMTDHLSKFKEFSFCIEYSLEMSERASIYLIAQNAELARSYIDMLRDLVNNNRLMNPSMEQLIAREFYRLRGFTKCTGRTYIKHFYESLKIGKTTNILIDTLIRGNFINDQTPAIINWGKLTMDKFQKLFAFLLKSTLEVIECHMMKAENKSELKYEEFQNFIDSYQSSSDIFPPEEDPWLIYQEIEDKKNVSKNIFFNEGL